jgi:hypothetical protein
MVISSFERRGGCVLANQTKHAASQRAGEAKRRILHAPVVAIASIAASRTRQLVA